MKKRTVERGFRASAQVAPPGARRPKRNEVRRKPIRKQPIQKTLRRCRRTLMNMKIENRNYGKRAFISFLQT